MANQDLQLQRTRSYHYVFVGFVKFEEILKKLISRMPYYKITKSSKNNLKEIFYDVQDNMLSNAGIVLSKSLTNKDAFFNIRRLSRVSKRNKKYRLEECNAEDHPREFAPQIASAIEHSFSLPLSIDLESIIKKTKPTISLDISKTNYDVVCGSGYRAKIVYEDVLYQDVATGKKILQEGMTLVVPNEETQETEEILNLIDKYISNLSLYDASRFEIAQKLLYTEKQDIIAEEEEPQE